MSVLLPDNASPEAKHMHVPASLLDSVADSVLHRMHFFSWDIFL